MDLFKEFSEKYQSEEEKKAFIGNPFADCIQVELDLRIVYQKVRLYLEKSTEKVKIEGLNDSETK
jgi:hypothetical protein